MAAAAGQIQLAVVRPELGRPSAQLGKTNLE